MVQSLVFQIILNVFSQEEFRVPLRPFRLFTAKLAHSVCMDIMSIKHCHSGTCLKPLFPVKGES